MARLVLSAVLLSALLTPEAFAVFEVRGRALGLEEQPVAGRAVLVPLATPAELGRLGPDGSPLPAPVDVVGLEPDGSFVLRAPGEGLWRVRIEGRGLRTMEALVPVVEATDLPSVYLAQSRKVAVVVRGDSGAPLAGARVTAHLAGNPPPWQEEQRYWKPAALLARADDAGRAVLHPGLGEDELHARAFASGWLSSRCQEMKGSNVEIRPGPAVEQRLRVVDAGGRPASGVAAFLTGQHWPLGTTNEDGELTMGVSSSAPLYLALATEELWMNRLPLPAVPTGEEAKLLEFTLADPLSLSGQVIDSSTGKAVAGALVWVEQDRPVSTLTDRGGGYSIFGIVSARSLRVNAVAAGYLSTEVSAEEGVVLKITLEPSASLTGRIVDVEGLAIGGAQILAELQGGVGQGYPKGPREVSTRSAVDGTFRLAQLAPWARYELEVRSPGFAVRTLRFATAEAGKMPEPLEVVLSRGARLHGLVLDGKSAPIAGAEVVLVPTNERGSPQTSQDRAEDRQFLYSGSEGRFDVLDLPGGRYDLRIGAKGFAPVTIPGVHLPEAGEEEIGPVVLKPGVKLEGKVTDRSGNGLEGATITVPAWRGAGHSGMRIDGSRGELELQTAADGSFTIPDLAPESVFSFRVRREGYRSQSVTNAVVDPDSLLEVVLEKALIVAGRLLSPEGEPVAFGNVALSRDSRPDPFTGIRSGGSSLSTISSNEDGTFLFDRATPGSYLLEGGKEGYLNSERVPIEVNEGGPEKIYTLQLRWGATVAGRVLDPDGEPISKVMVEVVRTGNHSSAGSTRTRTDETGTYRLTGVEAGTVSIRADHQDYVAEVKILEVEVPGHHLLDFVFAQGQTVTGWVVTEQGEPAAGVAVRLQGERAGSAETYVAYETVSGQDGSFRFPNVVSGSYRPEAREEGWLPARGRDLEVSDAPVDDVELTLRAGTILSGTLLGLTAEELRALSVEAHGRSGYLKGTVSHEARYRIGPLASDLWNVTFRANRSGRFRTEQLAIEEGEVERVLDIDFSDGLKVPGFVRRGGAPVAGAGVFAQGKDVSSSATAATGADGSFLLEGLEEGSYQVIVAQEETGAQHSEEVTIQGSQPIEIELGAAAIAGMVTEAEEGAPLFGAQVVVFEPDSGTVFGIPRSMTTGSDGRFLVEGLTVGEWRIVARKEGFAQKDLVLDLGPEGVDLIELSLERTEGLEVEVIGADGASPRDLLALLLSPVSGEVVSLQQVEEEAARFRLDTAPPGRWWLQVINPSIGAHGAVLVDVPGPPIRIRMKPAGHLSLRVPALEDSPSAARLIIMDQSGAPYFLPGESLLGQRAGAPLPGGRLDRQALPPGHWYLRVVSEDGQSWEGTAEIHAGVVTEIVME